MVIELSDSGNNNNLRNQNHSIVGCCFDVNSVVFVAVVLYVDGLQQSEMVRWEQIHHLSAVACQCGAVCYFKSCRQKRLRAEQKSRNPQKFGRAKRMQ